MDAIPQMTFGSNVDPLLSVQRRSPCVLILDKSYSMLGPKIDEMNRGLHSFVREISSDILTLKRCDGAMVGFGPVSVLQGFASVDQWQIPHLVADNDTPMGGAVLTAIDLIKDRFRFYKANALSSYAAMAFIISDGAPTDDISQAVSAVQDAEKAGMMSMFAIGVDGADMNALAKLSPSRPPLPLRGTSFGPLFQWVSYSMRAVANSRPNTNVQLPPTTGWAATSN